MRNFSKIQLTVPHNSKKGLCDKAGVGDGMEE